MTKQQAHDIVHTWNGGKTENCPSCKGEMDDVATMKEARNIAQSNFKPRINPQTPSSNILMAYGEKSGDSAVTAAEKPDEDEDDSEEMEFRPMIDVMHFSEDKKTVPSRIKLVPTGKFNTQAYGDITITKEKLSEMKQHFDEGVRAGGKEAGLPIDVEHGTTQYKDRAVGWIKDIMVMNDGAYGDIEWTPLGKELLSTGQYKFYSPEFHFRYKDPEQSFNLDNVMTGGGLVNKPMFKHDLPPIVMSEVGQEKNLTENEKAFTLYVESIKNDSTETKTMDLKTIIAKEKSIRSSDEQKFVTEHQDELTFAEAKKEGFVSSQTTTTVKANENEVVITAAEKKALEDRAALGVLAHEKLRRQELATEVKALTFSEKGAKIATDQVEVVTDLMLTMSEGDQTKFKEFLTNLPEKQIFTERGTNNIAANADGDKAAADLTTKAKEIQEANKGMKFSEALSRAAAANPELVDGYKSDRPVAAAER